MIRKRTIWTAYCEGCLADCGQFDSKTAAEDYIKEFPLCAQCDGEHY